MYVEADRLTEDQERFKIVVDTIDQFRSATKFFDCVEIKKATAEDTRLLDGLRFAARPGVRSPPSGR